MSSFREFLRVTIIVIIGLLVWALIAWAAYSWVHKTFDSDPASSMATSIAARL